MGGYSNYGFRASLERAQRFAGQSFPTYLRVYTLEGQDALNQEYVEFGVQVSASGSMAVQDILIDPPPIVSEVPLRDIGLNSAQLSFGARRFLVNHSWVLSRQREMQYFIPDSDPQLPDWYRVFRDSSVVGLFYQNLLFKIESITHQDIGSEPWAWNIVANAAQNPPTS